MVRVARVIRRLLLVLFAAATTSSCIFGGHDQADGTYSLTYAPEDVIRESCGHLSKLPAGQLWSGDLTVLGDTVRLRYGLFDTLLVGYYLSGEEKFTVDGSSNNVTVDIGGAECLVDIATIHLEATTQTADEFTGVLSVRYGTRIPATCSCELLVQFRADRQP